jgi:hypothetical protein
MNCRARRFFTLCAERLEDRALMTAGLSAALTSSGVLSIVGTSGNDTIAIHSSGSQLSIDGVKGTFNAALVKSVDIDGRGGNDAINLSIANGNKALAVPVTIHGESGTDAVSAPGGATWWLSGVGNTLVVASGSAKLDGFALSWFDGTIHDAALRTLLKQYFADDVLSRADMLAIFAQVEKSGNLSATDFADLKSVVNDTSLFKADYIQQLSQDVVDGNVANAHYQGQVLGNLAAGTSALKLTELVDKWFLGTDHPLGTSDWGPTYGYTVAAGQLFNGTPSYADIRQGGLGDCYFLTSLAETALRTPSVIQNMFIVNGDGTYTVRFYHNGAADYVTVDSALPVDQYGRLVFNGNGSYAKSASNVLWADLAEKAYVQLSEQGWSRALEGGGSQNKYTNISGGYIFDALSQITGSSSTWVYHGATLLNGDFNAFVAAWNAGELVGFASSNSPTSSAIVADHAYAVIGYNAQAKTITLYNPWGVNNGYAPGIVTLTWAQVEANFWEMDHTV